MRRSRKEKPAQEEIRIAADGYCQVRGFRGLSCDSKNLELVRSIRDKPEDHEIEQIYHCKICGKLYKYIYSASWQERNFDCDRGWQVNCDEYFKVEQIFGNSISLPVEEARRYGYQSDAFRYAAERCQCRNQNGLTCALQDVMQIRIYPTHNISKCRRCGEFYKRVWLSGLKFHFYKPGEEYEGKVKFFRSTARRLGYQE